MMILKNKEGYTLLEMIITIALIGIAISMSTLGLSTIFNSNVNSYANRLANEIRMVYTKELADSTGDYALILSYDVAEERYLSRVIVTRDGSDTILSTIEFPKVMSISKDGVDLNAIADESSRKFVFDASSGALETDGNGTYTIGSAASTITRDVVVVKVNGRVYVDDE